MPDRRYPLWPVVAVLLCAGLLVMAVIVGWSIVVPLYFSSAFTGATTGAKVGLWIIMGLGELLLSLVLVALGISLAGAARRQRLLRRLDALVTTLTHELRTPLTSLGLCLDTLERHDLDPKTLGEFVARMRVDLARLREFGDRVIAAAELEHGGGRPSAEAVAVRSLAEDCLARVTRRRELPEDWCVIAGEELSVATDGEALATVLLNLMDNAAKYAGGTPRAELSISRRDGTLVLALRDEGIGFAEVDRRRLFRRFSRLPAAAAIPGTGLGLHIVAEHCRRLGGRVEAASPGPGGGATFTVTLPVRPATGTGDG